MLFRSTVLLAICLAPVTATLAHADTFSSVVVYGDSLSDNGNAYKLSGGALPPSPPYDNGRFSNGPLAVEQLATKLGIPLTDFAFAGATSGIGNEFDGGTQTSLGLLGLPGMLAELASPQSKALLGSPLVASSLFVVFGGANDFLAQGSTAATTVADLDGIVGTLQAAGAKHILVAGVPDLSLTPDYLGDASASLYSEQVDALLQASLPTGATYVDTFGLLHAVAADPSAYGFTNTTQPCLNATTGVVCSNPSQYLFFDGFHPTTAADTLLADQFLAAATPTPEPSTFLLLGSGLAGVVNLVRRRRHAPVPTA